MIRKWAQQRHCAPTAEVEGREGEVSTTQGPKEFRVAVATAFQDAMLFLRCGAIQSEKRFSSPPSQGFLRCTHETLPQFTRPCRVAPNRSRGSNRGVSKSALPLIRLGRMLQSYSPDLVCNLHGTIFKASTTDRSESSPASCVKF